MSTNQVTPAPTPAPAPAPTPAAAPAPVATPPAMPAAPAPDLSSLVQPGVLANAPTLEGTNEYIGYQNATAAQAAAAKKAADLANAPTPQPYQGPHARLLAMVQGLSIGLSAFGTAMATKGKEGGAPEVQQFYAQQQQQELQKQEATTAQKNAQIQQQITIGETNRSLAQSYLNLLSLPDEITENHLKVASEQQGLQAGAQATQIQMAEFTEQNWGFTPAEITGTQSGQPGAAADPTHISNAQTMLNRAVGDPKDPNTTGAIAILGKDNPAVQAALTAATDPKANVQTILAAGQGLNVALQQKAAVTEAQKNQAAATSATVDAQQKSGAQAAYNAKHVPGEDFQTWQARQTEAMKQQIDEGDPTPLGEAMAQGLIAPSQIISSRSMSKPFYTQVLKAADNYSRANFGTPYDMGKAEDEFKYAAAPKTQNQLNMLDAITRPGGSLQIVANAASQLPGVDEKTLNKVFSGVRSEFGDPKITDFNAALVGFSNEYSAVMSAGGSPTDNETKYALSTLQKGYSRGQLQGALDTLYLDMAARGKSIIRDNPFLLHQYSDVANLPTTRTAGAAAPAGFLTVQIPGQPTGHIPQSALAQFKKDHPNAMVTPQ